MGARTVGVKARRRDTCHLSRYPKSPGGKQTASLEEVLISVWRQALVEDSAAVKIDSETYPIKSTARRGLKQIDFRFSGKNLRGLEQNPDTKSRWAAMAREGKKVM